ncbi:MAG: AhpC/TSA family protein [Muribaculum sp.]|nr:AhpC/TSA family protein [Muribaculum sp.]
MKTIAKTICIGSIALLASCGGGNQWKIDGKITDLNENDLVVLEGNNQGYWYPMDTLEVGKDGSFKLSHEAQGYPDIYRLRLNNNALYFPIDSIETLTITANASDLSSNYTLSGTPQARSMMQVDSLIAVAAKRSGSSGVVNDESLKQELGKMLLSDPAGIVTYYVISKKVNGQPLYNPSNKMDLRYIGAVANAFNDLRPSDPRTSYLRRLFLSNRVNEGTTSTNIPVTEVRAFDIKRFDNTGKEHSLLDVTAQGKVVLLNFTAYSAQESPAFNVALNKVYEKYRNQGFEIFQISLDNDEYSWKQTAKNLPWITVLNGVADGSQILSQYNVVSLPTVFLFNRNGELVERVTDIDKLDSAVAKLL